ncbi:ABC transporter permease [Streptomyces sp. NPDC059913]|uniref:ABC transporter permease n=1 Tax=unclassified Streptomyces TaxID=2593676 RepID=UPI00364F32F1
MGERLAGTAWVLWTCARMQAREMAGNHLGLIIGVVQPAVLVLVTVGSRTDQPTAVLTRWTIGVVLTSLWASTVWVAGGILRMELHYGTLAASVTSVRPGFLVLLGKCLGATLRSVVVIAVSVTVTVALTGAGMSLHNPGWLLLGALLTVASGASLGMLLACVLLLTQYGQQVSAALMYPVFILGGLLVPADLLPVQLRWCSTLISLRWAQDFLADAASGTPAPGSLGMAALLTLGYFVLAVVLFGKVVDRARKEGTLELV